MPPVRPRVALLAATLAAGLWSGVATRATLGQTSASPTPKKPTLAPVLTGDKLRGPKGF